jgi:hypothetical protein
MLTEMRGLCLIDIILQLGDGTATDRSTPSEVILTGVSDISAGLGHTCALMSADGGVRCWGVGVNGQVPVQCQLNAKC